MIANTVLLLRNRLGCHVRYIYPNYIHGWVYNGIRDTPIGHYYHEAQKSPFSIKEIDQDRNGLLMLHLVFFDERVMLAFLRHVEKGKELRLGQHYYLVEETVMHHEDHPKAGIVSYDTFYSLPIAESIEMHFQYTAFNSGRRTVTLPFPDKIVNSLLSKWNEVAPDSIESTAEYRRRLASGLLITSHHIHSEFYPIRKEVSLNTFSGRAVFHNVHEFGDLRGILNRLLYFAHYSGVGWKCSFGMGRVNLNPNSLLQASGGRGQLL
ncbi:CRISPR system precrRNA processing endoribonuclease RAMP protein Cas6 [Paenibacillus albus]|uniref:CRISPR system precrRNA processing endoribonuclease RAMP protein Cas6 n=1 Tax=Paenibacillus albus TaxID=2495582 RepID=A0A3S9A3Q3_9BACL|nr:CRISPR system precrRNA processing endoribonuclease RAMP protein Cas6 [Paenibacillus albus]AZN40346.1 CRISPR system precrRNA processing endoribonuclease RAMP protein Cas6 [Paenibacillus albus]